MNTIIKEILFDFIKAYKSSISKERDEAIELAVDKVEALINQERQEIIEQIKEKIKEEEVIDNIKVEEKEAEEDKGRQDTLDQIPF